jgi:hypothetical protein
MGQSLDKHRLDGIAARAVVLMDSISSIAADDAGQVVVSGSHGGRSSAQLALQQPLEACFFNDAGIGKDGAGIAALQMLDEVGCACATYDSNTARIGEALDALECGVISRVNRRAAACGFRVGESVMDAIRRVYGPPRFEAHPR